jgi:hypothetical protein
VGGIETAGLRREVAGLWLQRLHLRKQARGDGVGQGRHLEARGAVVFVRVQPAVGLTLARRGLAILARAVVVEGPRIVRGVGGHVTHSGRGRGSIWLVVVTGFPFRCQACIRLCHGNGRSIVSGQRDSATMSAAYGCRCRMRRAAKGMLRVWQAWGGRSEDNGAGDGERRRCGTAGGARMAGGAGEGM